MGSGSEESPPFRTVLLVGFMGSGKTTVGRLLADRLGWDFLDFDDLIEERAGASVESIFRDEGEERFRELEEAVGKACLEGSERVLASGGGWPVPAGRLEELDPGVLSVWLEVEPESAVGRAREDDGVRPLLEVDDPVATATRLLERRRHRYARARLHLDTEERSPAELVEAIERHLRAGGP